MARSSFNVESLGAPQAEVAYRLRAVRESMGLSLREFARFITTPDRHVSHTAVMKFEDLELRITPDYVDLVATKTGVPFGWLISGLGADEVSPATPALDSAKLSFLPPYLHRSLTERLENLADWCGVPPGMGMGDFFQQVGAIVKAPLEGESPFFRPWTELTQRELSVFIASQFASLRTVLRRLGEPKPSSGSEAGESDPVRHGPEIHSDG